MYNLEIFCADDIHKQKCCAKSHPVYVDWMNMTLFECPSESITDYNNVEYCKSDIDDNICCSRKKNKFTGSIDTILTPCTEDVYASFAESRPENSSDYGSHVWQGNASDIVEGEICFSAPDDKLCCSGKKGYFKNTIKHRCKDVVNIPDGHLPPSIKNDFEDNPAAWNKQESSTTETKYCYCDITHEECCTTNHESFKRYYLYTVLLLKLIKLGYCRQSINSFQHKLSLQFFIDNNNCCNNNNDSLDTIYRTLG